MLTCKCRSATVRLNRSFCRENFSRNDLFRRCAQSKEAAACQDTLSYHRVREAIASKLYTFFHVPGEENPADIVSKHWSHNKIWHVLQPLLFWKGDTIILDTPRQQ